MNIIIIKFISNLYFLYGIQDRHISTSFSLNNQGDLNVSISIVMCYVLYICSHYLVILKCQLVLCLYFNNSFGCTVCSSKTSLSVLSVHQQCHLVLCMFFIICVRCSVSTSIIAVMALFVLSHIYVFFPYLSLNSICTLTIAVDNLS